MKKSLFLSIYLLAFVGFSLSFVAFRSEAGNGYNMNMMNTYQCLPPISVINSPGCLQFPPTTTSPTNTPPTTTSPTNTPPTTTSPTNTPPTTTSPTNTPPTTTSPTNNPPSKSTPTKSAPTTTNKTAQ